MLQWDTSCLDWRERIEKKQSLIPFKPLFPEEAESAMDYMRRLRMMDVAGCPTIGDACRDWMLDFAAAIFGAYDAKTGRRLIRNFFMLIAKKNGKSTIAAAIMVTALLRNWRLNGEFLILAPTVEVANNSFGPACQMIRADPYLSDLLHIQSNTRTITHRETDATLKVVAADTDTVGGKKAIGVLIDELHLFGKKSGADTMLVEATGGQASRPEGFTIYLTTHSDRAPVGVMKTTLDRFRKIRDGKIIDKRSLGVLYEFPENIIKDQKFLEPKNFYMTNPNIGASVDEEWLVEKLAEETEKGKSAWQAWVTKHLNVEMDMAAGNQQWTGADLWGACGDASVDLDTILRDSEVVVAGIDGGGLDDLMALSFIGRQRLPNGKARWLHWCHCWAHPKAIERRKENATKMQEFSDDGSLTILNHEGQDLEEIADYLDIVNAAGLFPDDAAVGFDPHGVSMLTDEIVSRGFSVDQLRPVRQGWQMSPHYWGLERKLSDGSFVHGDQPIMSWAVGNAKVTQRGNAIAITKDIAGASKIDPLVSMANAFAMMSLAPEACDDGEAGFFASMKPKEKIEVAA